MTIVWTLLRIALPWILAGGTVLTLWGVVTTGAYNRGFEARDFEARLQIERMEARVKEALIKNENKTDAEIDCELRRLRNPSVECKP